MVQDTCIVTGQQKLVCAPSNGDLANDLSLCDPNHPKLPYFYVLGKTSYISEMATAKVFKFCTLVSDMKC